LDGIPQTLPDGQGQLTNVDLDAVDRIEVLRGPASALFGNATGGVISIWTDPTAPAGVSESARVVAGRFDRNDAGWGKWRSTTGLRLGAGSGAITVSRLDYTGEREHSAADLRNLNARVQFPISEGGGWRLTALTDVGDDP